MKDTGIGLAADELERIFDMFSQVNSSIERSQGGLGIGLALVKQLAQLHGGSAEAKSGGPGKGSEFIVRLPIVFDERAAAEPSTSFGETAIPRRVLIVDDNLDAARALAMLLEIDGNETETAGDGIAALAAIQSRRPTSFFSTSAYPTRRLRGRAPRSNLDVGQRHLLVILAGWGQDEDRRRSRSGLQPHFVKPMKPDQLAELLGSL